MDDQTLGGRGFDWGAAACSIFYANAAKAKG
jgi:hypothetical protein